MTPIPEKDLVEWLNERGLTWDEQHGYVDFASTESQDRFWIMPKNGARVVYFLSVVLYSLDPWEYLMVCKQGATAWRDTGEGTGVIESVHDKIVESAAIPRDFQGALRAESSDFVSLLTLLFNQIMFGWCMWDDVYVIPDHAQQIVKTSHHEVVHVTFRNPDRVAGYVEKLAAEEFRLPTEVPDETFKTPHWMKNA